MKRILCAITALLLAGHMTSSVAQVIIDLPPETIQALLCPMTSTPSAAITLEPYDAQRISIGNGSSYYTQPKCYHHIVLFAVPSDAGTDLPTGGPPFYTQHGEFSFDSLVNELIDTQSKCTTYAQHTAIYHKQSGGSWLLIGNTRFEGSWVNNKCKVKPLAGETDFRFATHHAPSTGTHYYRVASRATTGTTVKVPRGVCVGLRFADIQDVPLRSCAMPE